MNDGTFLDMKHATATSPFTSIDSDGLASLEAALLDGTTEITSAIYVVNKPLDAASRSAIDAANLLIRDKYGLPLTAEPILVVPAGDYQ